MKCFGHFMKIVLLVNVVESARILCVFPVPFHSHQTVLRILPEKLAKRGHELVIITPQPTNRPSANITEIDIAEVTNTKFDTGFEELGEEFTTFKLTTFQFLSTAFNVMYPTIDAQLSDKKVQELIKNKMKKFDLILIEDCQPGMTTIGARFKAPIILVSSFLSLPETLTHVGAVAHPLLYPYCQTIPESFWERVTTFIEYLRIKLLMSTLPSRDNELIRKHFGEYATSIEEVRKNVKMTFSGVNHMWDNCRPVTPSVSYMGAIHLTKRKPLPKDLERYLNASTQGVIYMSLGSKIQSSLLPPDTLRVIVDVFASLPYNVLWKWDGEELPGQPKNVQLRNWLPQANLLHHPSIKAFISQGGLHSTDEAIAAEVPLVGLPVFADQYQNVQKYKQFGIGRGLDIDNLKEEEFRQTIVEVAEDKKYRENIHRLARLTRDKRTNGLKLALDRIQYLLDHGAPPLPATSDVTLAEYFMLDIFVPLALCCIGCIGLSVIVFTFTRRLIVNIFKMQKKFNFKKKVTIE